MAGLWGKPITAVTLVFLALTGFRGYVMEPIKVTSVSMAPTLAEGDVLFIDKITPVLSGINPGDIVVAADDEGNQIVKRVGAIAGQTLEIYDSKVRISKEEISEPYIKAYNPGGIFHAPLEVPAGEVFLLGDNRIHSVDSRNFGTIPVSSIIGRVAVAVPLGTEREVSSAHG